MTESQQADIFERILADHERLRFFMDQLVSDEIETQEKRAIFERILPIFRARAYGLEDSLLLEGLRHEALRPITLCCLEENELAEISAHRVGLAVSDEVWEARVKIFCRILTDQLMRAEDIFPLIRECLSAEKLEQMENKYMSTREKFHLVKPARGIPGESNPVFGQAGKIGYLLAWLLGVPAWILLLVFLVRGH